MASSSTALTLTSVCGEPCSQRNVVSIAQHLSRALGVQVSLEFTRNRRVVLSQYTADEGLHVRLHPMFSEAPRDVVDAIARYLAHGDREASAQIERYVRLRCERGGELGVPRRVRVGVWHDLDAMLAALVARYAPEAAPVHIGWAHARAPRTGARRHAIRLGVYRYETREIRVNPVLDASWVPRYFVEWVVFHELMHHVVGPDDSPRATHHGARFRARERDFADRERALAWERTHARQLIEARALRMNDHGRRNP
jgi:hypothetical protein